MHSPNDYWGFRVTCVLGEGGWHWRVSQGSGASTTSAEIYDHPDLAIEAGQRWIVATTLHNSLNRCLSELLMRNVLHHQEYKNLMRSVAASGA
ncbi:MAG TPA: hypothetical protein IGR64_14805 [Leptolyngbyaceae cyanobacterium M65_K2018_010]|nr:hypothetical protein [Leptolyngbyaceae cyanobacterium M65_K2018_010]